VSVGCWVMVCGPSGAGKDSVLAWAAGALAAHPGICFARRLVTRATSASSDHDEVSVSALDTLRTRGHLAWHWEAHGHQYGVRAEYADRVAAGELVVVNGSREHAWPLVGRPDVRCVLVTAPVALLRARLFGRARESAEAVAARMERNRALGGVAADRVIDNDGVLDVAGGALRDYLLELVR